jgi:hypothetical protein
MKRRETDMTTFERVLDQVWNEVRDNRRLVLWIALGLGALWLVRRALRSLGQFVWTVLGFGMAWFWATGGWGVFWR